MGSAQLHSVLSSSRKLEATHEVVSTLATMASDAPGEVIDLLALIVKNIGDAWGMSLWHDHAQTVLRTVLASDTLTAREKAIALIHYLGAQGY